MIKYFHFTRKIIHRRRRVVFGVLSNLLVIYPSDIKQEFVL